MYSTSPWFTYPFETKNGRSQSNDTIVSKKCIGIAGIGVVGFALRASICALVARVRLVGHGPDTTVLGFKSMRALLGAGRWFSYKQSVFRVQNAALTLLLLLMGPFNGAVSPNPRI
jgi:hypothetical protein